MLFLWLLADIYVFQAIKVVTESPYIIWGYWLLDGMLALGVFYFIVSGKLPLGLPKSIYWGLVVVSVIPKLIVVPILLMEDIVRVGGLAVQWVGSMVGSSTEQMQLAGRRRFVSQLALGMSAVPLFGLVYGLIKGKYDYQVRRIRLKFKDLPDAFDGFTITQLSDIHSGSFDSPADVKRGVELVNKQKSDLLLFTGDLVNNRADEMDPWMTTFSTLAAPFGKFSILGNHDYGDYIAWESSMAKLSNLQRLKEVHKEIGFRLMLNENIKIKKDGQHIVLIGVENWGKGGFHKYGDLPKATAHVDDADFKILMSHDPSHWEAQTLHHDKHIHLTLSGHTHGMQFGIEIPGFKWSPIKYVYPQWAGVYRKMNKFLYVNRGFGFLGYPGRVGILPEITVITLEKG